MRKPIEKKWLWLAAGFIVSMCCLWGAFFALLNITDPILPTLTTIPIQTSFPTATIRSLTSATHSPERSATPIPLPTRRATWTLEPTFSPIAPLGTHLPTSAPPAACACNADRYNCADFSSHSAAQACFETCRAQGVGDIHQLDQDGDGNACESLP